MPISQDQITTLDQLEEKLTLALTDLLLLRDSNNEDYKVKASTILQAAVDKAGAELIGGNVESGNTKAVTGDEVANIMSALPNDAVLHYSFDDVPDIPDGTADVRLLDNNTFDLQSTAYLFGNNNGTTFSNENGNLKCTITGGSYTGCYIAASAIQNKIVKIRIKVTDITGTLGISIDEYTSGNLKSITENGVYDVLELHPTASGNNQLFFWCVGEDNSCTFTVEQIYIGDGSYVTPIIDNVNGENNATNNGEIAVQGVSGKGAYFPSSLQSVKVNELPAVTSDDSFSISLWLNISEMYTPDTNTTKAVFAIGNFNGLLGICRQGNYINFIARATGATIGQAVPMDKGNWHCYSMVYDGQIHTYNYYIDGVKQDNTSGVVNPAGYQFGNGENWTIWGNSTRQGVNPDSTQQPAKMDDVLFFDRALTDSEVMALYLNKANTPKYYNRADWKLEQIEAAAEE